MNKYIVRSRGVDYVVEADRVAAWPEKLMVEILIDVSQIELGGSETKVYRYETVAEFKEWDWWTQADKPLNIKTEDK